MKLRVDKVVWIGLAVFMLMYIIYHALPYSTQEYLGRRLFKSGKDTAYSSDWPISKTEYAEIKKQVEEKLESLEIIDHVYIVDNSTICISTLEYNPSFWQTFTFKKIDGKWELTGIRCNAF